MVKLRLTMMGRKNRRTYRLMAEHKADRRDSEGAEFLGYYDPYRKDGRLLINEEAVYKWLKRGAEPSETVRAMFKKLGFWKKWTMIRQGKDVAGVAAVPLVAKPKKKKHQAAKARAKAAASAAAAPAQPAAAPQA